MNRATVSLCGWILAGALLSAGTAAGYFTFVIIKQGGTLAGAPLFGLFFTVMKLPIYAGYGARGGLCVGLIERFFWFLRRHEWWKNPQPHYVLPEHADTNIRLMQTQQADAYLKVDDSTDSPRGEHRLEPPVENIITARDGKLTYRVMAYRRLEREELMQLVRAGLDNGSIEEPDAGCVTTIITTIGHGCGAGWQQRLTPASFSVGSSSAG